MRSVVFAALVFATGCSKCSKDASDAGAAVPDAGAAAVPDASVATARLDAGQGPSDAELLAAYAKDCRFSVERAYYERAEDKRGDECVARDVESCTADPFACCAKGETCRQGCGTDCVSCATACGDTCESCRTTCEGKPAGERESCVRTCASARLECRRACLQAREKCLGETCVGVETTCENEGELRKKKSCPDCTELGQCMWEDGFKDDHEKCLTRYPENAKECLVWCFQE